MLTSKQKKCVELMISGDFTQREIAQQIKATLHMPLFCV